MVWLSVLESHTFVCVDAAGLDIRNAHIRATMHLDGGALLSKGSDFFCYFLAKKTTHGRS